jgi:putative hydrolase of the HAD superfamily
MSISPPSRAFAFVLFDLDQTLCDRRTATRTLAERLYETDAAHPERIGPEHAVEEFLRLDKNGYEPDKLQLFRALEESWGGLKRTPEQLAEWLGNAPRTWYSEDPEVVFFLRSLTDVGTTWGIVTNGSTTQFDKARRIGVLDGSACFVVSEIVGVAKPYPGIFKIALNEIGASQPSDVLFVGDNPTADIEGAKKTGMPTAWIRDGRSWPDDIQSPDYTLDSVIECGPLLGI